MRLRWRCFAATQGLAEYEEAVVQDPRVRALAAKVRYRIDPDNPYPRQFTGHLRVTLRNGEMREARQDHFRGGIEGPLPFGDIVKKFRANGVHGGVEVSQLDDILDHLSKLLDAGSDRLATSADGLTPYCWKSRQPTRRG
jgi:2-methylcitrate dehydratase PrpD